MLYAKIDVHPGLKHAEKLTDRYKLDSLTLLLENLEKRNDLKRGTDLRGNGFQRRLLLVLLLLLGAGCLLAKPINVTFTSGYQLQAVLLWANDSLFYFWTGFEAFDADKLEANSQAFARNQITGIAFGNSLSLKQSLLRALPISTLAAWAKVTFDESKEDITLPLVFYSVLLAFPVGYVIQKIHALMAKPASWEEMHPLERERRVHAACRLNSAKHRQLIVRLEEGVNP